MIKRASWLLSLAVLSVILAAGPASARKGHGGGHRGGGHWGGSHLRSGGHWHGGWNRGGVGWGPYGYGWGWYDWPRFYDGGPYGPGFYNPYAVYYVPPPPRPDPAYGRLYAKCPTGRVPARWVKKVDKQGQVILVHQMGRCR